MLRSLQGVEGVFASEFTLIEMDRTLHRLTATGRLAFPDAKATRARLEIAVSAGVVRRSPREWRSGRAPRSQ